MNEEKRQDKLYVRHEKVKDFFDVSATYILAETSNNFMKITFIDDGMPYPDDEEYVINEDGKITERINQTDDVFINRVVRGCVSIPTTEIPNIIERLQGIYKRHLDQQSPGGGK